ncbi:MAG: bacteriohemerythrin [bacterium]|nr:bacteriohemerythrin [bacterium]
MTFFEWDQSYSVGVKIIDVQHKKLFSLISDLYFATERNFDKKTVSVDDIINNLTAYVEFHFGTEEKYFKEFKYDKTESHTEEHHFYERKIADFKNRYEKGEDVGEEMMLFLKQWLSEHIKIKDKEYSKCFSEHGLV